MGEFTTKIEVGIEEIILLAIVLVSIGGAVLFLPGDVLFLKKMVAWVSVGYLFYTIDLAEVFFWKEKQNH